MDVIVKIMTIDSFHIDGEYNEKHYETCKEAGTYFEKTARITWKIVKILKMLQRIT